MRAPATRGRLILGGRAWPVVLGRSGIRADKREGDGATPAGEFRVLRLLYRADRRPRPHTALPVRALRPDDGWCDDPRHAAYNRAVRLPFAAGHETMWRTDALYDFVLVLDHNSRPRIAGRGSAVFVHVAAPGFAPTAGCVALRANDLTQLVRHIRTETRLVIG